VAYVKKLPLMIVTHPGIDRGIFDRGTGNNFVFTEDLTNPAWPLSPQIRGAIKSWKAFIDSKPERPKLRSETGTVAATGLTLSNRHLRVLQYISENENCTANDAAWDLNIGEQRTQFFVDELNEAELIGVSYGMGPPTLHLEPSGRSELFKRKRLD